MTEAAPAPLFLDTSILVRYLVGTPPEQAEKARELLEAGGSLVLSEVAIAETAYALTALYRRPRAEVVDALVKLLGLPNLRLLDLPKPLALAALDLCRGSNRTSFSDALLWAQARHLGDAAVCTFDRRFPVEGITVRDLG